jgi:hypothetical protein
MKFFKPLDKKALSRSTSKNSSTKHKRKPATFGERRADKMNQSVAAATKERERLLQKEFISPDLLNKMYQRKGRQLDAKIRRLKDKL